MSGDLQPNSTGLYTHYKDFLLKGGMTIPTCGSLYIIYASGGGSGALVGPRRCEAQHRTGSGLGLSDKIIYISFSLICIARKNFSFCFQIRRISLCVSCLRIFNTQIPTHWCFFSTDGTPFKGRECFVWKDRHLWWFVVCRKRNGIQRGFPSHWGWACIWVLMLFDIPTNNLEIKLSEKSGEQWIKNQFRPSSSSPSLGGSYHAFLDLQEGQVEEATSSLLAILQDILAGSTIGATAPPPGEVPDMTDMTPKRPCSESAEVEVKRPRMADERLGKRKEVHRFFLVENHGILRLFLPIHYETSTDSVVLYPYWCGIDCHGRSLIPHCHCISSLQVEVLARRMLACCGSGSFTGGTWPKPHPSDTVSINRSNNVNVFRWRFWVCFYRQPMWLLNPTLSFFSKKHLLTRMSSLKTSPVDPFR